MLKQIDRRLHPHEVHIAQYSSSQTLAASANHCVPVYDVLIVPDEKDHATIVIPLLQDSTGPLFATFGEAVECIRQLFEVCIYTFICTLAGYYQGLSFMQSTALLTCGLYQ